MKVSELFEDEERSVLSVMGEQPEQCEGCFYCEDKALTSLEGVPSFIGLDLICYDNDLTSLHNIHKIIKHIGRDANFISNPLKSHVLGLLLIDGLREVRLGFNNRKIEYIINRHLRGDRDVFACQEELIENGFEDFAQL